MSETRRLQTTTDPRERSWNRRPEAELRVSPGPPRPPARLEPDTHADDRGDKQQHQHRDVEDDDPEQQEKHPGKFCSAEFLPGRRERAELDRGPSELA